MTDALVEKIAAIWAEVLGIGSVDPDDDFLALGGNSLHAILIVSRVEELVGAHLSVRTVLETRSVREMAEQVEQAVAEAAP